MNTQMKLGSSEPSSRIRRLVRDVLVQRYGGSRGAVRTMIRKYLSESEGGECFSNSLRDIFRTYYGVEVGLYTMGCFRPHAFGRGTTIGRYSSVARTAFAATLNHPLELKSTHAFFFNPKLGYVSHTLESSPLLIGNDVWLGHNSVIMPAVSVIGDGAVVAAGAVVNKDIPPYAVVVGNPARVVRFRFDSTTIERLLAEKWWEQELSQLVGSIGEFTEPLC